MSNKSTKPVCRTLILVGLLSLFKVSKGLINIFSASQTEVPCFSHPPIGCFPTSEPFTNSAGIAPQDPDLIPTHFSLHTQAHRAPTFSVNNVSQLMYHSDLYDPSKKTIFIIHGYMENSGNKWVLDMIAALRSKRDVNIMAVDWREGASNVNYYQSVADTRVIGAVVALAIQRLQSLGADVSKFHLVGFSLGAHIAGYAGSRVEGLARITGLDPARFAFEGTPAQVRLDHTDAHLVDVIHTDGEEGFGFGTMQPMGDVDFYPNGGLHQPNCPCSGAMMRITSFLLYLSKLGEGNDLICSHARSVKLFTASIREACPRDSPTTKTRRLRWAHTHQDEEIESLVEQEESWEPCLSEAGCPKMGYDLDLSSVLDLRWQRLFHNGSQNDVNLLVAMDTTYQAPFC